MTPACVRSTHAANSCVWFVLDDFISVNIKGDTVYSYNRDNKRVVCVKRCVGGVEWQKVNEIELQYGAGVSDPDVFECVVAGVRIYVSWKGEVSGEECHSVSKHDMSGSQVDRYGSYGDRQFFEQNNDSDAGLFYFPHISGVDGAGRMHVCDFM